MPDERLERLGTYFVHFGIRERYCITFEQFIEKVVNGAWTAWLA
ncbi:hypothetical protein [Paenibacillus sedimenti]|nr:hypothetical protein [Paenibacillus sedimenti]